MVRSLLAAFAVILATAGVATSAPKPDRFPAAVRADNGRIIVPKRPVRIVSISPTATEILFSVGAGRQVVAVDDQSNYPIRAPRTKLSGFTPSVEAIASYRPDLVITSFDTAGLVKGLHKLKIPVLVQGPAPNLSAAYRQIRFVGRATGHSRRANALVALMRKRIAAIVRGTPRPAQRVSVYHELSPDYFSAGSRTFIGEVYRRMGLTNIADEAKGAFPQLSSEFIVAKNPGLIILADSKCCGVTAAKVAKRPAWNRIQAVRSGSVVAVNEDMASRWGPRVVGFYKLVSGRVKSLAK